MGQWLPPRSPLPFLAWNPRLPRPFRTFFVPRHRISWPSSHHQEALVSCSKHRSVTAKPTVRAGVKESMACASQEFPNGTALRFIFPARNHLIHLLCNASAWRVEFPSLFRPLSAIQPPRCHPSVDSDACWSGLAVLLLFTAGNNLQHTHTLTHATPRHAHTAHTSSYMYTVTRHACIHTYTHAHAGTPTPEASVSFTCTVPDSLPRGKHP